MKIKVTQCICGKAPRKAEAKVRGLTWKIPLFLIVIGFPSYMAYQAFFTDELLSPGRIKAATVAFLAILVFEYARQVYKRKMLGHSLACAFARPVFNFRDAFLEKPGTKNV